MNRYIIKNFLLSISLFVFSLLTSAIYINFFCLETDILITSGDKPGFFELQACPYSIQIIFNSLIAYTVIIIMTGFYELMQSISLKSDKHETESRQLNLAAKLQIIYGVIFLVYLFSSPTAALPNFNF